MRMTEALGYLKSRGFRLSAHRLRHAAEEADVPGAFKAPGGQWSSSSACPRAA
jgi:hypothetical protein